MTSQAQADRIWEIVFRAAERDPAVRAQLERDIAAASRECRDNPGSAGGSLLSPETVPPCEPAATGGLA